jgi:hypothetical protein
MIRSMYTRNTQTNTVDSQLKPMPPLQHLRRRILENDIFIVFVAQQILAVLDAINVLLHRLRIQRRLLSFTFLLRGHRIALLFARDFLEAVELFSVELVEFAIDVLDCVFCSRDDDVFAVSMYVSGDTNRENG